MYTFTSACKLLISGERPTVNQVEQDMTHSGFLRFECEDARDSFWVDVLRRQPDIERRAFVSHNRPVIILENLDDDQMAFINSTRPGTSRWFEDVRFEPMD